MTAEGDTMTLKTLDAARLTASLPPPTLAAEFLTANEFATILKVSKRTLFRLRARGALPAPVEIATNIVRWRSADVRAYLDGLRIRKPRRWYRKHGSEEQK
jgi:predicted DNA-binding transcriptional regulator AlpA